MKKEVKIPDIAENVDKATIARILVSKGDKVSKDQPLVEAETDKATTDIPSEYEGTVVEIKISEGEEVGVNQVIMVIETEGEGEKGGEEKKSSSSKASGKDKEESTEAEDTGEESDDEKEDGEKAEEDEDDDDQETREDERKKKKSKSGGGSDIPAAPSVRRLAREKGIDLSAIEGSGPGGRITKEDVEQAKEGTGGKKEKSKTGGTQLPDFSKWGSVSHESMSNIRKATARNLGEAWNTVPHVTQFDEADLTHMEEFRNRMQPKVEKAGGKLTVTAILLKIAAFALQRYPKFNASIDMENQEVIYKHFFNVGIAVDTPMGLLVPVVREVDKKSLTELSIELTELAKKARDKKLTNEDMQGGNFTISNLGGIGGTAFTPIVYAPQVAILGVSRAKYKQEYMDDEFQKRLMIPLSLSYDHRLIDGADGARFLRWICDVIEDPYAILQ